MIEICAENKFALIGVLVLDGFKPPAYGGRKSRGKRPEKKTEKHPMKTTPQGNRIIESTDEYFDTVHQTWRPVPMFWIGDFVETHSHVIRSRQ